MAITKKQVIKMYQAKVDRPSWSPALWDEEAEYLLNEFFPSHDVRTIHEANYWLDLYIKWNIEGDL
jgi:hypothetical protein